MASLPWVLLRPALPYPDPLRRRRIRREARGLITCARWPDEEATPFDVAQLALLRLLWLQRETHRAAQMRLPEAVALCARASIETCIAGLYWLDAEEEITRLRGANAKSVKRILAYVAAGDPVLPGLVSDFAATLGEPSDPPTIRYMADRVADTTGESFSTDLYHRLYVPLSTFYSHASGLALLRHVGADETLMHEPMRVWSNKAAVHAVDACVARIAVAVAERSGKPLQSFVDYGNKHMDRTVTPMFVLAGRRAVRTVRWRMLPTTFRSLASLRRYYHSGEASRDTYAQRKARTKHGLNDVLRLIDSDVSRAQHDVVIERVAEGLAQSVGAGPDRCPETNSEFE